MKKFVSKKSAIIFSLVLFCILSLALFSISAAGAVKERIELYQIGSEYEVELLRAQKIEIAEAESIAPYESDSYNEIIHYSKSGNVYTITAKEIGTVKILAVDSFEGEHIITINVVPIDINDCEISGVEDKIYTGSQQEQNIKVTYQGMRAYYTLEYSDKINVGEQYVDVIGINGFGGTKRIYYNITMPQASFSNFKQTKTAIAPYINKCEGKIYYQLQVKKAGGNWQSYDLKSNLSKSFKSLKFKDKYSFRVRTYAVIDGKNVFGEWSKAETKVVGLSLNDCKISGIVNKVYNGKAQTQNVKVTYNGKAIKVKVVYGENKNIGYRYLTIYGTGDFADSKKVYYYIIPSKTAITGLLEKFDEKAGAFNKAAVQYNAVKGGVTGYQIAVAPKGGSWSYYKTENLKYAITNLKEGKIYSVRVRAYKQWPNGITVYGNWSATERCFPTDQVLANDFFYYNQNTITGYLTNTLKGDKILITVGGKTFTVKVTKDSKLFKFKQKIGTYKLGTKITLKYTNKFSQGKIKYTTLVYYASEPQKGFTKAQVKLVPGYEEPYVTKTSSGEQWEYYWEYESIYAILKFNKNGKLTSMEYYEVVE